jgi:hypothetical protein
MTMSPGLLKESHLSSKTLTYLSRWQTGRRKRLKRQRAPQKSLKVTSKEPLLTINSKKKKDYFNGHLHV